MARPPLNAEHRRAAAMLASGVMLKDVAAELGRNKRTLGRWSERQDFRDLIQAQRDGLKPQAPTAEATLVAALSATKANGEPSWPDRIAAAKALLQTPSSPESQEQARRVEIYLRDDDDDVAIQAPGGTPASDGRSLDEWLETPSPVTSPFGRDA